MTGAVVLTWAGGVATITLNRPDAANSINDELLRDLGQVAKELARRDARCVVLRGAGAVFSSGGDLRHLASTGDDLPEAIGFLLRDLNDCLVRLSQLGSPIVAAVHGSVAAGGLGLMGVADIVVAARSCRFVVAFTEVGFSPDAGTTFWLPRLVGVRRALELAMTNRAIAADEALAIGLVTEVVDDERLDDRVAELVGRLASGPTAAYGRTRRLLRTAADRSYAEQLATEADDMIASARTHDGREGIAAFLERRPPRFTGH